MKKRNTRSTLLVFLVCASISSAVYLNIISSNERESVPTLEMQLEENFDVEEQAEKPLPDVDLLKRVLRTGERVLTSKI